MANSQFVDLDVIIGSFPNERQSAIASRTDEMMLSVEASKLKGAEVRKFGNYLKSLGAHLFVRMPNGKEVKLPIP